MTATNKRYSYPRVAAIRIDVHHTGETRLTHHTHPTLSLRMVPDHTYLTQSLHSNLSHNHQQSWAEPLFPRKRALDTIHITMANRSTGPYQVSLPSQPIKQWGQSQPSVDIQLLALQDSYHRYAIDTFNTCSRWLIHRFLTDTGGGYNLGGADFSYITPRPSQPMISTFHLRTPPDLQFNQALPKVPKFKFKEHITAT
jgi:hypothetical protein